jgi:CheY-like chemotaxis protein
VVAVGDGREALTALQEAETHLIITDINMPGTDGIELMTAVRKEHGAVPVIAVSGGGVMPGGLLLGSARQLGAFATLAKPFELAELATLVAAALAHSE